MTASPSPSDTELRAALGRCFGAAVTRLDRRPYEYRSSFELEEVEVFFQNPDDPDGDRGLTLLFKDLGRPMAGARQAKPPFLCDPRREIEVYRKILAPGRFGTATCYGAVANTAAGRYWLFLEKVPGRELYQVGDLAVWQQAARWLAGLHSRFADRDDLLPLAREAYLLTYGPEFYRQWIDRAPRLERLAWRYHRVVARLAALPSTFLHGELYASNVLVQETAEGTRVCPVDWEMAAVGPGLIDLAALTAGTWSEEERVALALAYHGALPPAHQYMDVPAFLEALDWCRLHLAVQWLGWSLGWSPPAEHAHDWLGEALGLADKLGL